MPKKKKEKKSGNWQRDCLKKKKRVKKRGNVIGNANA